MNSTPIQKKPEESIHFEWRVGFFAFVAFLLLAFGWGWLKSFSMEAPQRFGVKFSDVAGLANNAPVNLNGVRVGVVEKIDLRGKSDVVAHLKITTKDVPITEGSKVTIQTLGLVGAKYVEINLPEIKEGEAAPAVIPTDSIIEGENPVRTELYLNKIATNV
ncbi:MAG: MCE family protein, partial [Candidatus Melainabacteria bacterium]|nr:MCE family protein [Candidatus Melainabacteria bacterium]